MNSQRQSPPTSWGGRRYYAFSTYLKNRYGAKVRKITIDAGFSCPNRDGTIGTEGCVFCSNESFSPQTRRRHRESVREQVARGIEEGKTRRGVSKFIAYFQAFTNTYAPPEQLRAIYEQALFPEVVALAIGTRPDCVPEDVLDVIEDVASGRDVWMEYGLQSANDETLRRIGRGHDAAAFADAAERTKKRDMLVCAHVILGLPGETWEDMMNTASFLNEVGVDAVKIHHLHVVRNTPLAEMHQRGEVKTLSEDEYIPLVADFLERLSPQIIVQRLVGDAPPEYLVAPIWNSSKARIIQRIEEELESRGSWQGRKAR